MVEHQRFWNTSPSLHQLHQIEDVLRGDPSLDEEMMDPGRLLRLGGGQSDPGNPEDGPRWTGERPAGGGGAFGLCFTLCCSVEDEQLSGEIVPLRAELVQKVLKGLRGGGYLAAQDLGVEILMKDGGIETLIATLKKMIFLLQSLEAKELYRVGQMQQGPLSRQTGESVVSSISRRR